MLWTWDHETAEFSVDRVTQNDRIEGHWQAYGVDYDVATIFEFKTRSDGMTIVTISEGGFRDDEKGRIAPMLNVQDGQTSYFASEQDLSTISIYVSIKIIMDMKK